MFKAELRDKMLKLMQAIFNEEQGNRITANNMEGITMRVMNLLNEMEIKDEKPKSIKSA